MSPDSPRVLVVEDEPSQVELLRYNLVQQGFKVSCATDGEAGLLAAIEEMPDLILLDWMLPNLSGIELCRQLRRNRDTRDIPIIMLTARSEESDMIRGLDVGADDYVSKPYSVKELMARVRAALRRPKSAVAENKMSLGAIEVDIEKHMVTIEGKPAKLSPTEYRLLITLMQFPGRVFSRDQLLSSVWGFSSELDTRTVDVHIGRLKKALGKAGKSAIKTVRGFGYSMDK